MTVIIIFLFFKKKTWKNGTCYVAVFCVDVIMKQVLSIISSIALSEVYMLLMVHISAFRFGENMDFNSRMEMDCGC